jgi:hypothetical protein
VAADGWPLEAATLAGAGYATPAAPPRRTPSCTDDDGPPDGFGTADGLDAGTASTGTTAPEMGAPLTARTAMCVTMASSGRPTVSATTAMADHAPATVSVQARARRPGTLSGCSVPGSRGCPSSGSCAGD